MSTRTSTTTDRGHGSRRPSHRLAAMALVAVLGMGGLAACSSSDETATTTTTSAEEAYCAAWANLASTFGAHDQIDVVNQGLDSVRRYVDDLNTAFTEFQTAASGQFEPQVAALKSSLENLTNTIGGSNPTDGISSALSEVETAWSGLVTSLTPNCPKVTVGTTVG